MVKQTDIWMDGQRYRQTDVDRQPNRETYGWMDSQTQIDGQGDRHGWMSGQTERLTYRWANRQKNTKTDRQTDRQTDRLTD